MELKQKIYYSGKSWFDALLIVPYGIETAGNDTLNHSILNF